MDVAASEFYTKDKKYNLDFKNENADASSIMTGEELGDMFFKLSQDFPIESIEDPFDQVRYGWLCWLRILLAVFSPV